MIPKTIAVKLSKLDPNFGQDPTVCITQALFSMFGRSFKGRVPVGNCATIALQFE